MIRTLRATTFRRPLIGLAVAASLAVAVGGAPAAHAARPSTGCLPVCLTFATPTLAVSASQRNGDGTTTVTFTGQNYTPGGEVDISLFASFGSFGTTQIPIVTTTASTPRSMCSLITYKCYQTPGGNIGVTVTTPFCGPGVEAYDKQTDTWSNTVAC